LNISLVLLLVGCSYIAIFGGLSLLRREGLPLRLAVEGLAITAVFVGLSLASIFSLHPIFFLLVFYLLAMRVRLLIDVSRLLRNVVRPERLLPLYSLALRLWPDAAGRVLVQIDRGATLLRAGRPREAVAALEDALAHRPGGRFNPRYEAICRYNLGQACRHLGEDTRAYAEYNQVIELLPGTIYAQLAERALHAREAGRPAGADPPGEKDQAKEEEA